MIWLIGLGCLLAGAVVGALAFKMLLSDEARVQALEEQLQALSEEHENYKSNVHNHFNSSAQLLGRLTESYRDVFLHVADGARTLCPDYISNQLSLSAETRTLLGQPDASKGPPPAPPLDYAARTAEPGKAGKKVGTLDEDYGFDSDPTQH